MMNHKLKFTNTHSPDKCEGRPCIVHNPTDHHMSDWPAHWRYDRGILERICTHGVGHPDPDQFDFWQETNRMYDAVHGCDRCCTQPTDVASHNSSRVDRNRK